jgi:hypothetical protein
MEDIPELYCQPYDPKIPSVCMDGQSRQPIGETGRGIPAGHGKPERTDYEYERNGTANIFMFTEPPGGQRYVSVTERRTSSDWAVAIKELADVRYPEADMIRPVCDNLNTHKIGSLYEIFPPEQAGRIAKRPEIHHTPEHGSRLNIAEIELSALTTQCIDRRIPDIETLRNETGTWERIRNGQQKSVDWQFTTEDARIKLRRLYPVFK